MTEQSDASFEYQAPEISPKHAKARQNLPGSSHDFTLEAMQMEDCNSLKDDSNSDECNDGPGIFNFKSQLTSNKEPFSASAQKRSLSLYVKASQTNKESEIISQIREIRTSFLEEQQSNRNHLESTVVNQGNLAINQVYFLRPIDQIQQQLKLIKERKEGIALTNKIEALKMKILKPRKIHNPRTQAQQQVKN